MQYFNNSIAQPSWHCELNFKMYDENGEAMNYDQFIYKFELLDEGNRNDLIPWHIAEDKKKYFYNDTTQYFHVGGSVIYNPLIRKIVSDEDTMLIVIPGMYSNNRGTTVDSLVFRPGNYYLPSGTLPYVDFEKAAKAYDRRFVEGVILDIPSAE